MCKLYLSPTIVFLVACVALSPAEAGAPEPFKVDGHTYVPVGKHGGGAYTIRLSLAPSKGQKTLKGFGILFAGNRSGEGYWLSATEKEWELLRRQGSARDKIAAGKTNSILAGKRVEVRIKKHPWLLAIAFNGRVVCEVPVDSQSGGLVAVDVSRSSPASPPLIQDLSELNFSEQFMRAEDELDLKKSKVWKIHAGKWQIHSVRENVEIMNVEKLPEGRKPQINRSPNPFSVSGFAKKTGLIHTGKWFWDDYKVSMSVRNRGADAIGLAFNISDPKNYFLLRWENNAEYFKPTPMELVEVKNGKNAVIREVWVNGQRDEWFNLAVRTCGTRVQVFLDEAEIMDLRNDRIIGGGIGLYVEGGSEKAMAYFDDVRARTLKRIDFTDPQLIDNWPVERSGKWEPKSVDRQRRPSQVAPRLKSKNGVLVFGTKAWPAPVIRAKIPVPNGSQKTGFLLGSDHAGNGRFRVTVGRVGKNLSLAIEDQSGGKTKKLAFCEDIPVSDRKRVTLEVDATREGEINVCLDDTLQLRTVRAVPAGGKAGIFAQNAKGVSFEGLRVLFTREEDKERLPAEETFKDDPYMKHWSSAQGSWWPAGEGEEGFWHVGDFYGRSDVEIPLKEGVIFVYAAKEISRVGGYALVQKRMTANDSAFYRLTLLRKGQKVAEADVNSDKAPDDKIVFHKHDRYLWVTVGTKQLFCFRDPDPLPETKVAVSGISADDLAALEIHRYQVRDEYFEQATSDWLTVGRWDVTTRFTCDPRWSHMACMTDAAGVLMSKFEYEGDLTVEAFMGMRMHPGGQHYPRVGDLNLAFSRNIRELSSGYSFVVAGWDEFWSERATYLMKGTTQLAYCGERLLPAMRRPGERKRVINVPWIRGGRDVHGAWYYVKARKQRGELDFYVDNHQAYRFHDPQPIEKVRPAVWTYNAWIVVARIKISYQRRVIPGRLVAPPQQQKSTGLPAGCKLVSETHPGFSEGFEGKDSVWQTSDKEQGGQPEIVPRGENAGNCLRVTNISTGGSFGVDAPVKDHKIDARLVHKLQFDYRISRHSKINLYLDIGGRRYFVGMTGPEESDTKLHRLGFIDAETDGKWHSATFELGAVYRDALKNSSEEPESHKIQKLAFGNLHPGLLAGGVGGNPMGARYFLDNFAIRSVGGGHFTAKLSNEKKPDSQILAVVDQKPDTVPARPGSLEQKELASGLWYCHTRIKPAKGRASAVQHFPFLVTPARISLKPVSPKDAGPWGYGPIRFKIGEEAALRFDVSGLSARLNGQNLVQDRLFDMEWDRGELVMDLVRSGIQVENGKTADLQVNYKNPDGSDGRLGMSFLPSLKHDKTPPTKVELVDLRSPNDFEEHIGAWKGSSYGQVMRDNSTAASGYWSLLAQNASLASPFTIYAYPEGYSAGRYPIIEFDYKIHEAVRVDMILKNSSGYCSIGFTDNGGYGHRLGEIEKVRADNRWHHGSVNVLNLLKKLPYRKGLYTQQCLSFADHGHRACAPGAYYRIDNFRPVPLISRSGGGSIQVKARDAGGVEGYSYIWTTSATAEPDNVMEEKLPSRPPSDIESDQIYLHIKARDRAGNWGPSEHFRFLVDDKPPRIAQPRPGDGVRSASSKITFDIEDEVSAVDPGTLKMTVGGVEYGPDSRGVDYLPKSGRFVWDWIDGGPQKQDNVPDGKKIKVTVKGADFAGNRVKPFEWEWIMDYSRDKKPPTVPVLECSSLPVLQRDDFEDGTDGWNSHSHPVRGAHLKQVVRNRKSNNRCLKLTARRGRSYMKAYAVRSNYKLDRYPLISFEYRIPEKVRVNLLLRIDGKRYEVGMTNPKLGYKKLGEVEGIESDGKWHHCLIDLKKLFHASKPKAKNPTVQRVSFGDNSRKNRAKSYWMVDNFMISGSGKSTAEFSWKSRDVSGIGGYSVGFSPDYGFEPKKEQVTQELEGQFKAEKDNLYWLVVRAKDSVGNWSGLRRFPYPVSRPEPETGAKKSDEKGE